MKKKFVVSPEDKEDWVAFTKQTENINPKESDFLNKNIELNKVPKLDLHGTSLSSSNEIVKKFIIKSSKFGYKKILIITGKGLRSKSYDNPYASEKLSVLRYHVPEFIKNDENLNSKIIKIVEADKKSGGEGAFFVFLKKNI
ncbi:Smr/MutS family protein [Pelagibacteraceae bacterium]|nr:Smr/MutS family protein [Pelagibacteraceae bacterium]